MFSCAFNFDFLIFPFVSLKKWKQFHIFFIEAFHYWGICKKNIMKTQKWKQWICCFAYFNKTSWFKELQNFTHFLIFFLHIFIRKYNHNSNSWIILKIYLKKDMVTACVSSRHYKHFTLLINEIDLF